MAWLRDFRLDRDTGDLVLDERGNVAIVEDAEAAAQALRVRLQFFLGEWWLNRLVGVPYFEQVFVKNPDLGALREIFRAEAAASPGVEVVESVDVVLARARREATIMIRARLRSGETVEESARVGGEIE